MALRDLKVRCPLCAVDKRCNALQSLALSWRINKRLAEPSVLFKWISGERVFGLWQLGEHGRGHSRSVGQHMDTHLIGHSLDSEGVTARFSLLRLL